MNDVIEQIRGAFAADERPDDAALLHPDCHDDMDLQGLCGVDHWSEVPDEAVVDSTVWAFLPDLHGAGLAALVRSKWAALDVEQRAAIAAFLRAMFDRHADAEEALTVWVREARPNRGGTSHEVGRSVASALAGCRPIRPRPGAWTASRGGVCGHVLRGCR